MTTTAPRRDRRSERHARTKAEILDDAWALAGEQGLTGWSLRDVADAVGMRAPSLYVYFDSKNALYDGLYADGYRVLLERAAAVPRDAAPEKLLRSAARMFVQFCAESPPRHLLMFVRIIPGFEPSPASYALAEQSLAELGEVLAEVGAQSSRALDMWTALLTGLATQQVSNDPGGDRWTRLIDDAADMFLAAFAGKRSS